MKYSNFIVIILFVQLFISCQNERERVYFNTGEVYCEKINEHTNYYRYYFKTGEIFIEGMCIDSLEEGLWKRYYSDGTLCAEAIFHKGKIDSLEQILSESKYSVVLEFENNPNEIKVGSTYHYRVIMHGLWEFSIITPSKLGVPSADRRDDFPYKIKPKIADTATIKVKIFDSDKNTLKIIPYVITVVE